MASTTKGRGQPKPTIVPASPRIKLQHNFRRRVLPRDWAMAVMGCPVSSLIMRPLRMSYWRNLPSTEEVVMVDDPLCTTMPVTESPVSRRT